MITLESMAAECRQALLEHAGLRQMHASDQVALESLVLAVVSCLESPLPASDTQNCERAAALADYCLLTLCPY